MATTTATKAKTTAPKATAPEVEAPAATAASSAPFGLTLPTFELPKQIEDLVAKLPKFELPKLSR